MHLLDPQPLITLQHEFRLSMRRLYADLCVGNCTLAILICLKELKLPTSFFDHLRQLSHSSADSYMESCRSD